MDSATEQDAGPRRSGRVSRAPVLLSPSPPQDRKRKRPSDVDDVPGLVSDNDDDADSGVQVDTDESKSKRRKSKNRDSGAGSLAKAAQTHINGSLPERPAPAKTGKRKPMPAKIASNADLYALIFESDVSADDVVDHWLKRFEQDQADALMHLINLLLRCTGCRLEVNRFEIEDPDNAANKIGDLQEEYQAQNITDYPLVAKAGSALAFRKSLTAFFAALVKKLATNNILYDDPKVLENIWVWMGSMSSSSNRPFRHTATVTSLSMISALCEVAKDLISSQARLQRQIEGESKKKKVNQSRIKDLETQAKPAAQSLVQLNSIVNDWFDALFLQRYRDTMPTVRVDCALHLTHWIMTNPEQFFDGSHLRYLGWTLADQDKSVRLTVLKQLQTIYRDESKTAGLHHFTERFRPRMVEMATRDVDLNIRATAVELLSILRDAGLVEPDDVDTVGRLIYDSEPPIRKAVAPFLVASVDEVYAANSDELGGEETISDGLPKKKKNDYESVGEEWLKFKSLAELLVSFDPVRQLTEEIDSQKEHFTATPDLESRFCLATDAIYPLFPALHKWEILAGYLLVDHSHTSNTPKKKNTFQSQFREKCKLSEKEEVVLLDVLYSSVKASLSDETVDAKDKKIKRTAKELQLRKEKHDEFAQRMTAIVPKLLKKFGAVSEAAAQVLRLETLLDLEAVQELWEDSTAFESMLDDVRKQFMSHDAITVLNQAATALHHAKSSESFGDLVSEKVQLVWDELSYALVSQCHGDTLHIRGNLHANLLSAISATTVRLSVLSRLFNCVDAFDSTKQYVSSKTQKKKQQQQKGPSLAPIDVLIQLLNRSRPGSKIAPGMEETENALSMNVMQCILSYFLWHAHKIQLPQRGSNAPSESDLLTLIEKRSTVARCLYSVLSERHGPDPVRVAAAKLLLDLHVVFVDRSGDAGSQALKELADEEVDLDHQTDIVKVFSALEMDFAKKSSRKLEAVGEDDEPEDLSEDEADSSSEDEAEAGQEPDAETQQRRQIRAAKKYKEQLVAEHDLCDFTGKLIRAIIAGVLDRPPAQTTNGVDGTPTASARRRAAGEHEGPVRQRLAKNRGRLGNNFKALIDLLDRDGLPSTATRGTKVDTAATGARKKTNQRRELVQDPGAEEEEAEAEVDADVQMGDPIVDDDDDVIERGVNEQNNEGASEVESILGD